MPNVVFSDEYFCTYFKVSLYYLYKVYFYYVSNLDTSFITVTSNIQKIKIRPICSESISNLMSHFKPHPILFCVLYTGIEYVYTKVSNANCICFSVHQIIPPRGCAFVMLTQRKDAAKALDRLRGSKLLGNTLKVSGFICSFTCLVFSLFT